MTGYTPEPWCWWGNVKNGELRLATPNRGRLIILDHHRQRGELPFRFRDPLCVMRPAGAFASPDHNGEFFELDHPDARLIVAAPRLLRERDDLLEACEAALATLEEWQGDDGGGDDSSILLCRDAIEKAKVML